MAYDLLIKNGTVVDGTGAPRRRPTSRSRTARSPRSARSPTARTRRIDAAGLVVAPGFVDPHTHYDAQICWDPPITPSSWHGVTTVVMGNCGVGIAPCRPEAREIATRDLVNVEAIPFEVLEQGHHLGLGELSRIHGRRRAARLGDQPRLPRAADAVSPLRDGRGVDGTRRDARGDRARSRRCCARRSTPARSAFRPRSSNQHIGYQGRPLACRNASRDELTGLCQRAEGDRQGRDRNRADPEELGVLTDDEERLARHCCSTRAAGRSPCWRCSSATTCPRPAPKRCRRRRCVAAARCRRPRRCALTRELNMRNPFSFAAFTCWGRVFDDKSKEAQRTVYADPAFRNAFREELKTATGFSGNWERITVHEVAQPGDEGATKAAPSPTSPASAARTGSTPSST